MGAQISKEQSLQLSQLVVLYGYHGTDFPWKEADKKSFYHTNGILVQYNGKKYVVTIRSRLICCRSIILYYYVPSQDPHEKETVMENKLSIIFQSVEYNILILGTCDKYELDLSMSEPITGIHQPGAHPSNYDLSACHSFVIPTKRSRYHIAIMSVDTDTIPAKNNRTIYEAKFRKAFVHDETYLPPCYLYKFSLVTKTCPHGICGAIVFNKKCQLVGMVTRLEVTKIFVLPGKVFHKIIDDFVTHLENPGEYKGVLTLPLNLTITEKMDVEMAEDLQSLIKKNDKLLSVNGKDVIVSGGKPCSCKQPEPGLSPCRGKIQVYDPDFKDHVSLESFLALELRENIPAIVVIQKKNQPSSSEVSILPVPYNSLSIPFTTQSYYNPKEVIPFVNLNHVIIVELTHELLELTVFNKITLSNSVLDNFWKDITISLEKQLLIIDCTDKMLAKKHNLPKMLVNKKHTLKCPIIKTFNQKPVTNLADLTKLISEANHKYFLECFLQTPFTISLS